MLPLSLISSSAYTAVHGVRRHLREVRRAGAKCDGEPCSDDSLLMEMAKMLRLNVLLSFLGLQLVKFDEEPVDYSPLKKKFDGEVEDHADNLEEDSNYVPKDAAAANESLEDR